MSLVFPGATSGAVTVDAPAVAGTTTLTLPATSGTLMVANTSGITTSPSQPAFVATGSGGSVTITSSANIPFNQLVSGLVGSTRSSGYNTSTYAYTAPVAGLYCFYAQMYISTACSLAWLKNGSQLSYTDVALFAYTNQTATQVKGGSIIVELAAGDSISTRVRSGEGNVNVYMGHSCFLGYLIG